MNLFNLPKSNTNNNMRKTQNTCKPTVEALEDRQMLTCNAGDFCGGAMGDYIRLESGTATNSVKVSIWLNSTSAFGNASSTFTYTDTTGPAIIKGEGGNDIFEVFDFPSTRTVTLDGGTDSDTLIATTANGNAWYITGADRGRINANVNFSDMQQLRGSQNYGDGFGISPGASISGSIDGRNLLRSAISYAAWTTPLSVNLATGTAPNVGGGVAGKLIGFRTAVGGQGNDTLTGSPQRDILRGWHGNDKIYGGNARDVLLGGEGNDELYGEGANDMLIGNNGADYLVGGRGSDLILGGSTRYDNDVTALEALGKAWADTPTNGMNLTRQQRIDLLSNGFTGDDGRFYRLSPSVGFGDVTHDADVDRFVADAGSSEDWWIMDRDYLYWNGSSWSLQRARDTVILVLDLTPATVTLL